jgi:hypothetical protein
MVNCERRGYWPEGLRRKIDISSVHSELPEKAILR